MRKWQRIRERHYNKLQAKKKNFISPFHTFTHSLILPHYTPFFCESTCHIFLRLKTHFPLGTSYHGDSMLASRAWKGKGAIKWERVKKKEWEWEGPRMRVKDKVRSSSLLRGCYSTKKSREYEKKRMRKAMEKDRENKKRCRKSFKRKNSEGETVKN